MRVYLSGPMQGYKNFNYEAFHEAAANIRAMGHDVINPAENFGGRQDLPYAKYMDLALEQVATADLIVKLPGWQASQGVRQELKVAFDRQIDHKEYAAFTGKPGPQNPPDLNAYLHDDDDWAEFLDTKLDWDADKCDSCGDVDDPCACTIDWNRSFGVQPCGCNWQNDENCTICGKEYITWAQEKKPRITDEAYELVVQGERQSNYGHPEQDFRTTGRQWGALIENWLRAEGFNLYQGSTGQYGPVGFPDIPPKIVALMMAALKASRESQRPKRDNRVDGIGYWLCADRIEEGY